MPTFEYSAYGAQGQFAQGRIDAASHELASRLLGAQGLTAFQMKPVRGDAVRWWQRDLLSSQRTSLRQLASFTREFATLMSAEIPLDDALRILCDQAISESMKRSARDLRAHVLNGLALSEAMQNQAKLFSADYLSMVRAGELGGNISGALDEIAELLERRAEISARVRSALVYPAMLLALAGVAIGVIVGVLVPNVAGIFEGSGRPLPTMLGLAMALNAWWPEIALLVAATSAAAACAFWWTWNRPDTRRIVERTLLRLPILGTLVLDQETGRFTRVLGTLLKAGVPLLAASISARGVVRNGHMGRGFDRAIDALREGAALHHALQTEACLPVLALRMISVGEEAGKLGTMLLRVAVTFEQKTQRTAERFMTILTPLITVAMACVIGGLVLTVIDAVMSVNDLAVR
jgi:general secretion pathway protein F